MAGQRCFLIERASCRQMLVHAAQRDPACGHLILAVRPVPALLSEDFVGVHARHGGGLSLIHIFYKKYDDLQHDFHDCYVCKCGNSRLVGLIHQMNRYFMKREYANVGADELYGLLRKANEEHAEIVRLFELRDGEELQRFIRDVHWSIDNAKFLVW